MARGLAEESTDELYRLLGHLKRDMESQIKKSNDPMAVKVRKAAGLRNRFERIDSAIDGVLSALYTITADAEEHSHHAHAELKEHRKARISGARAKLAKDPKQAAKVEVKKHWENWKTGRLPKNIKTTEQFAMDCMRQWPALTSAKVICAWSATWNKEARAKLQRKNPAC
jgi:tRNA A37 threonylcarbamoyladenosine dehydratase